MPTVLHVGCGPKTLQDLPAAFQDGSWKEARLDIDPSVNPDVIGSMTDLGAVESGSMQAVFSSHNLEHLYAHEVPVALSEFRRVLDPTGFVLITCPDLQAVAGYVAEGKLLEPIYESARGPIAAMDILFGHRAAIEGGNSFMAHRGGFTMRTLADAVYGAGFPQIGAKRRRAKLDLWTVGYVTPLADAEFEARTAALLPP